MTRRGALGIIGIAIAALLSGCGDVFPTSYRFRMTVEVETPHGVRTGSSVYEVSAANTGEFLPEAVKRTWSVKGEALAVDLPGNRTLFALLKTEAIHGDLAGLSMTSLDPAFRNDIVESAGRIRRNEGIRSPALVSPDDYPLLVTFRDIRDPKSVARVDAADFAATFGSGAQLKGITVAVTDEPVTTGIEKRLAWLRQSDEGGLDPKMGVTAQPTFAQQLGFRDFRRR